ncbi:hypothetical protein VPH35_077018 [Triticum aestivum]
MIGRSRGRFSNTGSIEEGRRPFGARPYKYTRLRLNMPPPPRARALHPHPPAASVCSAACPVRRGDDDPPARSPSE